jgi:23S rRNA pseudouridine1911/1915/1917 synthase
MAQTQKTFTADQVDEALATALHRVLEISHRQAKGLIDANCVKVNGADPTGHGQRLIAGDKLEVSFDAATVYKALPKPTKSARTPYEVLWEDKHLLFVNKPAGLLTVPTETGTEPNLADAITDNFNRRGFKRFNLYIVHRLDRFTSGVLVFAKTPEALHGLKKYFAAHDLNRVYKAVVVGEIEENSGSMHDKLIEHAKSLRIHVDRSGKIKGSKQATTHYRVLERLPGHTVVEVKLETGRRNQIRVQFADKGFPLLGDQVYGEESTLIDRQALHAELLGFRHPVTEEMLTVMAPLPSDMEAALRSLRTRARVKRAEEGEKGDAAIFKPKITFERKQDRIQRALKHGKPDSQPNASPSLRNPHVKREPKRVSDRPSGGRTATGKPSGTKSAGKPRSAAGGKAGRPVPGTRPTKPRKG